MRGFCLFSYGSCVFTEVLCMGILRLDKFIASQMNVSRNDAKRMIREKKVTVNAEVAVKPETYVDPLKDTVICDNVEIKYKKYVYIMMNKPEGVVSASTDKNTSTVIDLVPDALRRPGLFPAGRLDKDTTGFVMITDDGTFAHEILSPARHVEKAYSVTLSRLLKEEEAAQIEAGMTVGEDSFRPAKLRLIDTAENSPVYEIVLTQGKYHQIKRTFAYFGINVLSLHRERMGGLLLDASLAPGECREITAEELELLQKH